MKYQIVREISLATGSQTFQVEAENRKQAEELFKSGESKIVESDVEVEGLEDLDEFDFSEMFEADYCDTVEVACYNCMSYQICEVRKHHLSGYTPANEMQKRIAHGPDHFADISGRINRALAENCKYYSENDID